MSDADLVIVPGATQIALSGEVGIRRRVVVIITDDTQTVTAVDAVLPGGGTDGEWTARDTYTAQGKKIWLYDRTSDTVGALAHYTPATDSTTGKVVGWLNEFECGGDAIRAVGFAAAGADATTLTLPSITATDAFWLYTVGWDEPGAGGGEFDPQSPLHASVPLAEHPAVWSRNGDQDWRSSSATGTRSYVDRFSRPCARAVGVIMLIGEATLGGWGVGQIRMGPN
jgi:hypothetical protein